MKDFAKHCSASLLKIRKSRDKKGTRSIELLVLQAGILHHFPAADWKRVQKSNLHLTKKNQRHKQSILHSKQFPSSFERALVTGKHPAVIWSLHFVTMFSGLGFLELYQYLILLFNISKTERKNGKCCVSFGFFPLCGVSLLVTQETATVELHCLRCHDCQSAWENAEWMMCMGDVQKLKA